MNKSEEFKNYENDRLIQIKNDLVKHCTSNVLKNPYNKVGMEHYIFLQLLNKCTNDEFNKILKSYEYVIKE